MNILVPIDFSAASRQAMRYAYFLAGQSDAKVILLHVFDIPLILTDNYVFAPSREEIEALKENHILHLIQFENDNMQIEHKKIDTSFECVYGNPADQILQYAKEENIDLIIMGNQGRCMKPGYFMGSTFTNILQHSPVPVMALHGTTRFSDLKNILFTYDIRSYSDNSILKVIFRLAYCFKAHLYVLNVCEEISDFQILSESLSQNELGLNLLAAGISFHLIQNKNTIEGIKDFLSSHSVDLISFIPREDIIYSNLFKESNAGKATVEIEFPILSFHN